MQVSLGELESVLIGEQKIWVLPEQLTEAQKQEFLVKGKINQWSIIDQFTGADLVGIRYERLFGHDKGFPAFENEENAFRVIPGDFVTTEDGTGIVHISPTFGADDFRVAQQNGVPALLLADDEGKLGPIVDRTGRYVPQMGEFGGRWVKNYDGHDQSGADYKTLDESIAIRMKGDGTAFKVEKYEHTYPHCWRTDKPVLYYPLDSWFIRTTAVKDRLIELNKTINWQPASTGAGPLRQLARKPRGLEPEPLALLGHAPAHLAHPGRLGGNLHRQHRAA